MAKTKPFKLGIETGNAAFADGNAPAEVARILRNLADRIEGRACLPDSVRLFDSNGNTVGFAQLGGRI
jgi:hypothetical protein